MLVGALSSKTKHTELLSADALKQLGEHLISVILEVKHAGAIDKMRIGLTTLCERLLDDYDVAGRNLSALPMRWLTILLNEEIVNKAKLSMKDRVRRSAGIPFAFLALLLSEKSSSMRPMLKYAIEELFRVLQIERDDDELFSTQIHAFNVLRVIFKDRDLSLEAVSMRLREWSYALREWCHATGGAPLLASLDFVRNTLFILQFHSTK